MKYGQTTATQTAVTDSLPDEPAATPATSSSSVTATSPRSSAPAPTNLTNANGYPVTNASGNLVDLYGNQINGQYTGNPGFPGFGPIVAAQSLAYVADMQESGVPSPMRTSATSMKKPATPLHQPVYQRRGAAVPGDPCYVKTPSSTTRTSREFFARLAADGINKPNTLFVFASDEGDHFAGANVGRAIQPTAPAPLTAHLRRSSVPCQRHSSRSPSNTPIQIPDCSYANTGSGTSTVHYIGEDEVSAHGLLAAQENDSTPFTIDSQGPVVYCRGQPVGCDHPPARAGLWQGHSQQSVRDTTPTNQRSDTWSTPPLKPSCTM